jgi:transcriptional regulator with XRE-family HTH domain
MRLKDARLNARLTQGELAQTVGCANMTISHIENDLHPPRPELARRLEQALGTRIDFPGYPAAQEYRNADTLINLLATRPKQVFTWIRELPGRTRTEFFRKASATLVKSDPRNLELMLNNLYEVL